MGVSGGGDGGGGGDNCGYADRVDDSGDNNNNDDIFGHEKQFSLSPIDFPIFFCFGSAFRSRSRRHASRSPLQPGA